LNINMGALDLSSLKDGNSASNDDNDDEEEDQSGDYSYAVTLLTDLAHVYHSMDREKQSRVIKRLQFSGALPLQRDTSSYATIMSILDGGFANQFSSSSPSSADAKSNDISSMFSRTIAANASSNLQQDQAEEEEYLSRSRAEAKRLHQERMSHLRAVDNREQEGVAKAMAAAANPDASADPKQPSAFQIAVSLANASDAKPSAKGVSGGDSKAAAASVSSTASSSSGNNSKFRLLGDLPSLGGPKGRDKALLDRGDVDVVLSLELHNKKNESSLLKGGNNGRAEGKDDRGQDPATANIPKEFLCAINGHVMKEPMRARTTGLCFEAATIELWLNTRGAVCPITNTHLDRSDLEPAEDLRNRIKRYHIQQMTMHRTASGVANEDDLYDF